MDVQRPISSPVRKHPMQYPCSSIEQILVQGERGRSHSAAGTCTSDILGDYEAGAGMFKPRVRRRILPVPRPRAWTMKLLAALACS